MTSISFDLGAVTIVPKDGIIVAQAETHSENCEKVEDVCGEWRDNGRGGIIQGTCKFTDISTELECVYTY